ncbi:hypothetical protein [Pedobacter sp. V48]|uniref:hypothetical protein n=1 Tax=Pedobacter sp. V48 TaxID=509635 RepID=UPI0003E4B01B|nr:hypothetical protein [Pedobacter sp. V48]ETZ21174.1 hypothetical protein N824_03370 [Pedobacter sp. V48]
MNETFNFTRFLNLFKKHTAEQYKTYLMSTGVLIGVLILVLGFISYSTKGHMGPVIQAAMFVNFLFFSGTIFTSLIFTDLGDRKKSIPALSLPASHFEKYLVAWLYSFVIFQLVFLGCFYAIDYLVITIGNANSPDKIEVVNVFSTDRKVWVSFLVFAILHSICFFGAVFFEKLHFIKTVFSFFIFIAMLCLLNPVLLHTIFQEEIDNGIPFNMVGLIINKEYIYIEPTKTSFIIAATVAILISVILWISTYFRLKEKQV